MREIWFLTIANFRKNKGQSLSFFLLILLAAAFLNLGLVVRLNYTGAFDLQAEKSNEADSIMILQEKGVEELTAGIENRLQADRRIAASETRQALIAFGKCHYGEGESARLFALMNTWEEFGIGRVLYREKMKEEPQDAIYLPYIFQAGSGYELGDSFLLQLNLAGGGEQTLHYTVAGFFEEPLLATINSSTTGLLLGAEAYERLEADLGEELRGRLYLVQLEEPARAEAFTSDYGSFLAAGTAGTAVLYDTVHYEMVKQARTVTSSIGALIAMAFALLMAVISLIIVRFRIGNSIEEEMQNIGALEAMGCTGRQIAASFLLQYTGVAVVGTAAGIAFSYLVLPLLAGMFARQTGIDWQQSFDPRAAAVLLAILLSAVAGVVLLSTRKARKLQPIVALRGGIFTHSFRKNPLPLERRFGNLQLQLGGKAFCLNVRHNLFLAVIIAAISFAAVFAGVLYYNISWKTELYYRNVIGETPDIVVTAAEPDQGAGVLQELRGMPQVRKAIYYGTARVQGPGREEIYCYLTEDFSDYDVQERVYEGRFPRFANETAVGGLLAREMGKEPGDTITFGQGETEKEYLITGLIQGTNYLGHDAVMTQEAYRRLAPDYRESAIAVYLKDRQDTQVVLAAVKGWQGERKAAAEDYHKTLEASMGSYQEIVEILVAVILAVTVLVIALTLYLVIRTSLLREKQQLGVMKALGFTTGQLVLQKSFSFLPVVLIGAAAGCVIGYSSMNPVLSILFSGIGMMRTHFVIPLGMLFLLGTGITLAGFLISALISGRIRKITAYSLIRE